MRGFDCFNSAGEVCGQIKDPQQEDRPFKNQTRKGRPFGKKKESKPPYRAKAVH